MKILVGAAFELSATYAHVINTIKMAQGFARCGHDVALLCRRAKKKQFSHKDFYERYGITESIQLLQIGNNAGEGWRFALNTLPKIWSYQPDIVYTRNYILPWLTSKIGLPTVGESHAHEGNRSKPFLRYVAATHHKAFRRCVTISPYLARYYYSLGVPEGKIKVLPDAVDLQLFARPQSLPESPYDGVGPNIVYCGHLYDYKGIPTVLESARMLPQVNFHLVGGLLEDIERQKKHINEMELGNVILHGHVPHADVANYLWHASVLLLPPSANHPSAKWTSPVKIGEYLASGVPVIATSITALKYWLTEKEVKFIPPDSPSIMADAIADLLKSPDKTKMLVSASLHMAKELSYTSRAKKILAFL